MYLYRENKGADQLAVTVQLICVFVFAYAKRRFSHGEAQDVLSLHMFFFPSRKKRGNRWQQMILVIPKVYCKIC